MAVLLLLACTFTVTFLLLETTQCVGLPVSVQPVTWDAVVPFSVFQVLKMYVRSNWPQESCLHACDWLSECVVDMLVLVLIWGSARPIFMNRERFVRQWLLSDAGLNLQGMRNVEQGKLCQTFVDEICSINLALMWKCLFHSPYIHFACKSHIPNHWQSFFSLLETNLNRRNVVNVNWCGLIKESMFDSQRLKNP